MTLWHRQQESIAQGCLTNSKHPRAHIYGVTPTHIVKAQGCMVWDENGKAYIDYIAGLGANLFGYADERIGRAVRDGLSMGASHSLATRHEIEAAEKLKEVFYWVDKVKWVKTGSNACQTALKIARAATGRKLVLSQGYHGEAQEFCDCYNKVPGAVQELDYNFGNLNDAVAAVIVEPVITDFSPERVAWLAELGRECQKVGALLIYDEIITGLRFPKHSVSAWANHRPDLICVGKAIANGLALAAVCGPKELMDRKDYFASTTYGGDTLALAAAREVFTLCLSKHFDIDVLWKAGETFKERFNAVATPFVRLNGYPTRGTFNGDPVDLALFRQEACKAGLLFGPSPFFTYPHMTASIQDQTFAALEGVFKKIRDGRATLEGEMPVSPLALKVRS